jgi:hypothetical protein
MVPQLFKNGTTNRKREYTRKGGGKGWFTIIFVIEFCKLNHQLATTLRQKSQRNIGTPQLSMNVSPIIQKLNNQLEKIIYKKGGRKGMVHPHPHH